MICDLLYEQMELCGIAERCEKMHVNKNGEKFNKKDVFGLSIDINLIYPDFLLHVDKTGFNLNSRNDGNIREELQNGDAKGEKISKVCNKLDCRITVLGFANSIRDLVICVVIVWDGCICKIPKY